MTRRGLVLFAVAFGIAAVGTITALRAATPSTPPPAPQSVSPTSQRTSDGNHVAGRRSVAPRLVPRGAQVQAQVQAPVKSPAIEGAPQRGAANPKVTVVLFGRHDSSRTLVFEKKLKQLEKSGKARSLRVVWKDAPMKGRAFSQLAAEAVRAAGDQGKFWPMHDWILTARQTLTRSLFEEEAKRLGLDVARFGRDLDSHRFKPVIDADAAEAAAYGIGPMGGMIADGRVLDRAAFKDELDKLVAN